MQTLPRYITPHDRGKIYLTSNNRILLMWIFIQTSLFVYINISLFYDKNNSYEVQLLSVGFFLAKSSAFLIIFNFILLFLTVNKLLISFVSYIFPIYYNVKYHICIIFSIVFFTMIHVFSHIYNFYIIDSSLLVTSPTSITGFIIVVFIFIICITSINKIKEKSYNIFMIFHFILYFGIVIILSFHGCFCFLKKTNYDCYDSVFWKYTIVPFILFISEKFFREYHGNKKTTFTSLKKYNNYYLLQFYKPSFEFYPGQWILINCPEVSMLEWHPFTITSNTNEKGNIEIFIKNSGDWTNKFISTLTDKLNDEDLKVKISYPYGYRFNVLSKCRVLVIIAGGIGITRFISLIRSLPMIICKDMKHNYLQKVYLHWVCKDFSDFNCFMNVLIDVNTKLNEMGHYNLLNIQFYITKNVSEIPYSLFNYNFNRPNFKELFLNLANEYDNNTSIQILFCGIKDIHYDILNNIKKIKTDKEYKPLFIYKNLN